MARYWSANRRYIRRYHPRRRRVAGSGFVNKAGPFFVSAEASGTQADLPGMLHSLHAAHHVLEMFRRTLPNGADRRILDRLMNRLTKILSEVRKLGTK